MQNVSKFDLVESLNLRKQHRLQMQQSTFSEIDELIHTSLSQLAADTHVRHWRAKERDWVNYFAHRYLLEQCRIDGPLRHAAQIGIEVAVPQPPGYIKPTVSRDLVIWPEIGGTCWTPDGNPCRHPLAILEWKVHRRGHLNRNVIKERAWLRAYCQWQPSVIAYAVEVLGHKPECPLKCTRFFGQQEDIWLNLMCS